MIAQIVSQIVKTACDARKRLSACGLEGEALEIAVGVGANERHASRVEAALFASVAWALTWDEEEADVHPYLERARAAARRLALTAPVEEPPAVLLDAWAILEADAHGVGGHRDCEGIGTCRHPGLDALGKGRKHATDGPSWDAAIVGARGAVETALARKGILNPRLAPDPSGVSAILGVAWSQTDGSDGGWDDVKCIHPRWAAAVAAGHVLRATEQGELAGASELAGWGRVFNLARRYAGPNADPWVAAIRDRGGALAARLWASGILSDPEEERLRNWLHLLSEKDALACARLWQEAEVPLPSEVEVGHGDHHLPRGLLLWGAYHAPCGPEPVSVQTYTFPGLGAPCGLYGPAMGDPPVGEQEVRYAQRTPDRPPSRLVDRLAPRPDDRVTFVVLRGATPTLLTAYAGPSAPREPGDPSLPDQGPEREEAVKFWAEHALCGGEVS